MVVIATPAPLSRLSPLAAGPDAAPATPAVPAVPADVVSGLVDIEALKRAHPVEVEIARYVDLRPEGRALRGLCPFHTDRYHPNFVVRPDTQRWRCYRCGLRGDVIEFIARLKGLDFVGACAYLMGQPAPPPAPLRRAAQAAHAGADHRSQRDQRDQRDSRERHWDRLTLDEQVLMNTAAAIYQHCLWRDERALDYVRSRGLPDWLIRASGLGYADGHSLETYLRRRGGLRLAEDLGLLRRPGRGDRGNSTRPLREFLAGRIVVPEIRGGQPIWFIGRAIEDGGGGRDTDRGRNGDYAAPKYLGLPGERPVLGFERAAGRREVLLCEGVFDYLVAVSWRLAAWSPCGTQLPRERLGFLARARAVYGAFDGDDAGREATERFGEYLGHRWRPLALPDGTDLNDLACRPGGRESFFALLAAARAAPPVSHQDQARRV